MTKTAEGSTIVDTSLGKVEFIEHGKGAPVLFVHGSPGGCDQGAVMTEFLVPKGFRVIALSRPGYLGTPLTDEVAEPDRQADLALALMETLGIDQFAVMCWSGGGPLSYRLSAKHGDRVSALVALAGLTMHYEFGNGINSIEYSLLTGSVGNWFIKEMSKHTPKTLVRQVVSDEGDLTKEQAHELSEHIWNDETKREFILKVSATFTGRHDGLKNDQRQFPKIGDLGLSSVTVPTLLVHGTADSDVHPDQSENGLKQLPHAELLRVKNGTHLCAWTDPTSEDIQTRIVTHLKSESTT
jgi:pimeloyl-ACP methyl ester carboxylesterase